MEASTHHTTMQHPPTCNHSTNFSMAAHYIAAHTPIACHHSAGTVTRNTMSCTLPILHALALLVKPNLRPQPSEVCPPRSSRSHVAHGYCDPANSMHQQCGAQPPANTRTWSVFSSVVAARICSRWACCAAPSGSSLEAAVHACVCSGGQPLRPCPPRT